MPDEPQTPQPGEPGSSDFMSNAEGAGEQNLDDLLAQAAALVEEVSTDLGRVDAGSSPDENLPNLIAGQSSGTGLVERELSEVDQLLSQTREALGASSSGEPSAQFNADLGPPPATTDRQPAGSQDIPDFMAEFTRSDTSADTERSADSGPRGGGEATSKTPPSKSGSLSAAGQAASLPPATNPDATGVTADETSASHETTSERPLRPTASGIGRISSFQKPPDPIDVEAALADDKIPSLDAEAPVQGEPAKAGRGAPQSPATSSGGGVPGPMQRLAMTLAGVGVSILEMVDRPVSRLGDRVREILGLCAVATAAAAFILLLVSLFR